MRVAICEDEGKYAAQLVGYINEWAAYRGVFTEIFAFPAAEKFLYEWESSENYDVLFLDIKMGSMTGMELAKIIRKTNKDVAIVFATSMKEYAVTGYTVDAMQYLLKPVLKGDCFDCLDKVYGSDRIQKYFLFNDTDKTTRVPHKDIIYIEKFAHNAEMTTVTGKYTFRKTIAQLLEELGDDLFAQCHKSYIINIRRMESLSKNYAVMSDGSEIPLGKNAAKEINEKFYKYNVSKAR